MNTPKLNFVLITPARNEETFLPLTIDCVVRQEARPLRWVIVSDGSTDKTDDIIRQAAAEHPWIQYLRMPERTERHFAGKVGAFTAAYETVKDLSFDLVGNLDADIAIPADFYLFLLNKFAENPRLGLGGAPFTEGKGTYDFRFSSVDHVSGACQLFRRECYEGIGGYVPVKCGGIDVIAVLSARMKGWQTRTFPERTCQHHRKMGSAHAGGPFIGLRLGRKDYLLGRHPLWQLFRSFYQMTRRPFIVGGAALCIGYFWAMARRLERPVSPELIAFQRRDQMQRLKKTFAKLLPIPLSRKAGAAGPASS